MTGDREQFGTALGLSAGVNAVLFLAIVWAMAVQRGLFPHSRPVSAEPEMTEIVLSMEPESRLPEPELSPAVKVSPTPRPKADPRFVEAPDGTPEQSPENSRTTLISSRNTRAASELDAEENGAEGLPTVHGAPDRPVLDLRDSDFRDGDSQSTTPSTAGAAMKSPAPEPLPLDRPPSALRAHPLQSPPGSTPAEAPPLAFRDNFSPHTVPLQASRPAAPVTPPPSEIPPAPLDSRPPAALRSQRRAARISGKITNKGSASVDALKTPEGRYDQANYAAFEKNWRPRQAGLKGLIQRGSVEVYYEIDAQGRISGVKLMNPGEANPILQDLAVSSVLNAKLPPPPPELFDFPDSSGNGGRLRRIFTFLHF
ncbi:MAG: hypothetical protein V4726_06570 [Verrucomicrobiota bacterium]